LGNLSGKVALVTGAEGAIGSAIARHLATLGARVVVNYLADGALADKTVKAIERADGSAIALQADVSNEAELDRMFAEIDTQCGRLDYLVNNAGTGFSATVDQITNQMIDTTFAVNVKGAIYCTQRAIKRMQRGSRIINISSSTTVYSLPYLSVYTASKAVLKIFSEVWAKELADRGINVNSVMPGPTSPGMLDSSPPELKAAMAAASPYHRLGTPDDIGPVVAFLCSEESGWISGQHLLVNGAAAA
jgi:3-oxoacyl-[acyl-carrier protein] reductase